MTLQEAIDFIRPAVTPTSGIWADIGAGTGTFTEALMEILEEGKIYAVDKSPHGLYINEQLATSNRQNPIGNSERSGDPAKSLLLRREGNKQDVIGNKQLAIGKKIEIEIIEGDFHRTLDLPMLDGILMANALHYANDHHQVLKNVLSHLKPGGTFILIEYDTETSNPPWVPNPLSFDKFKRLCEDAGLSEPIKMNERGSVYQDGRMYLAVATKLPA